MSRYLTVPALQTLIGPEGCSKILPRASQGSGLQATKAAFDTATAAHHVAKAVTEVAESGSTIRYWAQKEEFAFSVDEKRSLFMFHTHVDNIVYC
jgi:hypothetical protein